MFGDQVLPGMLVRLGERYKVVQLQSSNHHSPQEGVCVMEAVSVLWPGQDHTDRPSCVNAKIMTLGININDLFEEDDNRQILWKFVPKFMGTDKDGLDEQRAKVGYNWLREYGIEIPRIAEHPPNLGGVTNAMFEKISDTAEGDERVQVVDSALSALMPHEPPSLAKLQWENLQETYGKEITPSQSDIQAYADAGMAVAL